MALRVKGLMKMMTIHLNLEQLSELKEVLEDEFSVLITTYLQDAQLRQGMVFFQATKMRGIVQVSRTVN